MSLFPKRLTFKMAIWVIGIVMALAIPGWPLLQEAYARRTWQRIRCLVVNPATRGVGTASQATRYMFLLDNKVYICVRRNFWTSGDVFPGASANLPDLPNDFCYVDGAVPPSAVLRLDAYKHPEDGIGHFAASAMVLGVCAFITLRSRRPAVVQSAN